METTFSAVISQLRKEQGISQKQAALDLGISQALLSHYEKGIRECGLGFVVRAASYYHVTSDYLLGLSDKKFAPTGRQAPKTAGQSEEASLLDAAGSLLNLSCNNREGPLVLQANLYYMLCMYRAAVSAGQQGLISREMFQLDFNVGRALCSAAMAREDAKTASMRSRSHRIPKEEPVLHAFIKTAEDYLLRQFPLEMGAG